MIRVNEDSTSLRETAGSVLAGFLHSCAQRCLLLRHCAESMGHPVTLFLEGVPRGESSLSTKSIIRFGTMVCEHNVCQALVISRCSIVGMRTCRSSPSPNSTSNPGLPEMFDAGAMHRSQITCNLPKTSKHAKLFVILPLVASEVHCMCC